MRLRKLRVNRDVRQRVGRCNGRVEKRRGGMGFVLKLALRFLFPLIERNVRIARITLSDWLHVRPTAHKIGAIVQDG